MWESFVIIFVFVFRGGGLGFILERLRRRDFFEFGFFFIWRFGIMFGFLFSGSYLNFWCEVRGCFYIFICDFSVRLRWRIRWCWV